MKTRFLTLVFAAFLAGGVVSLQGCKEKSTAEKTGATIDKAAGDAADKTKEAGDALKEATEGN